MWRCCEEGHRTSPAYSGRPANRRSEVGCDRRVAATPALARRDGSTIARPGASEPEDQGERLLRPRPQFLDKVVAAGTLPARGIVGRLRRSDRERIDEAIDLVGLADRADAELRHLSGGQQQRALIAKALAGRPRLLALDEPTTGVDAESQEALGELLARLHADLGVTVLYVSHEFGAVERFVERVVLVRGGVVFDGPPTSLPAHWHDPSHVHP